MGSAYVVGSWLLIQVAETVFPLFGFDDTPARIVVIMLAIAFVPALIFAWAFELTPDGLKKDSEVDRSLSVSSHSGKKLDRLIMVVLAVALGYFAFDKFVLSESREASIAKSARQEGRSEALVKSFGEKSIAVLPFLDLSPAGDHEYFSDGVSEELLNLLARIPELRVISRSSAFSLKGKDIPIPELGKILNVAHILEGSVRKSNDRLRITVQLIEVRSDTHLWSESYDREAGNIFAIQDEIAANVVDNLKLAILGEPPSVSKPNPEAHNLLLQARYKLRTMGMQQLAQIIELAENARDLDPEYDRTWVFLADMYQREGLMEAYSKKIELPINYYDKSRKAIDKALELNPQSAGAYKMLGWLAMKWDNNLQEAIKQYSTAQKLNPNGSYMEDILIMIARYAEATRLVEHQLKRDPLSAFGFMRLSYLYGYLGQFDKGLKAARTAVMLNPDVHMGQRYLAENLLFNGHAGESLEVIEKLEDPQTRYFLLSIALRELGQQNESEKALKQLRELESPSGAQFISQYHGFFKETEKAFSYMEVSMLEDPNWAQYVLWNPYLNSLHDDPRWTALLEKHQSPPAEWDAIQVDFELPVD